MFKFSFHIKTDILSLASLLLYFLKYIDERYVFLDKPTKNDGSQH